MLAGILVLVWRLGWLLARLPGAVLAVAGLSAILATYASALLAIKLFGGAYLLWLAYKSFRSAMQSHDLEVLELEGGKRTVFGYARRGFLIQITNPKAALAWIAIISLGLKTGAPVWVGMVIVLGTFALSLVIHIVYAVAFSTPLMIKIYGKARRYIQAALGGFFAFAGIKLLLSRD